MSVPRRRVLRFSLRALLILALAIGSTLGWTLHKAREQGVAIRALKKAGLEVYCPYQEPLTVLERLRGLLTSDEPANAFSAWATFSAVTDSDLTNLAGLPHLSVLSLRATQIGDAGLVHAAHLTQLHELDLDKTHVTDAGVVHLHGLTQLELLSLGTTKVSDAGLVYLRELKELKTLYLAGTDVTDAGLAHLRGLAKLQQLFVGSTTVTDQGIDALEKALPGLKIYR